ncbi:MAG TPA: hypothetical protein VGO47_12740 [Chlamydiales bacterium]|jgi:hypothetical protein|nr:hypothetical protein [Chlamydiales bacterium]
MTSNISANSRTPEFETAGRFYPALHSFIQAGMLLYQPRKITVAQIKALSLLQTGNAYLHTCLCGDFREQVAVVCTALHLSSSEFKKFAVMPLPSGGSAYPNFELRQGDVLKYARQFSKPEDRKNKLIVGCGWGMFLLPGHHFIESTCNLLSAQQDWLEFCASPSMQCAKVMEVMDTYMDMAGGDFEMACSMFHAGNCSLTKTAFGKRAQMTLNRLIGAGHSEK